MSGAALAVPGACVSGRRPTTTGGCRCGREIRLVGTLGRESRRAAYDRQLGWARGEGLDPASGFLGLSYEVGPNPAVELLRVALETRLATLPLADDLAA
jgi:hypothetical protein